MDPVTGQWVDAPVRLHAQGLPVDGDRPASAGGRPAAQRRRIQEPIPGVEPVAVHALHPRRIVTRTGTTPSGPARYPPATIAGVRHGEHASGAAPQCTGRQASSGDEVGLEVLGIGPGELRGGGAQQHEPRHKSGVITLRHNSRLHHIGLGRRHAGTRVLVLVRDLHIRVINTVGELLRELTLDPSRDYQPQPRP